MALSSRTRIFAAIGAVIVIAAAASIGLIMFQPGTAPGDESIELTLLENAGVMIEAMGLRIYVDPYDLPDNQSDLPADAILVTHPHGDHYDYSSIELIETDDTVFIFPENMTTEINRHDAIGVTPGDQVQVGDINITAFYMYTWSPPGYEDIPAGHPEEANWTSYIIDVDGFTIFHAGDSKNLPEYAQLTGAIDVAMLPLGPGCQTMAEVEVVDALDVINPDYFVPIHFQGDDNEDFCTVYQGLINQRTNCEILELAHFESYTFEIDGGT
ncbi:MAG: MBL fold metallo-hydrolase [Candidatus Thorarchaeota archaeon]|nr:MAG: MBL fold metallo-hydrolase [Candidatus Thorarchaeota archaeon]